MFNEIGGFRRIMFEVATVPKMGSDRWVDISVVQQLNCPTGL